MIIRSIRHLDGPNIYLYRPVLVMELDLEDLAGRETREIEGFNDRLLTLLPGLHEHVCGLGVAGGLVRRLQDGTYFGHVVEHVALELSTSAGAPVNFGKTRVTDDPRVYHVIVEATSAPVMRALLHLAVDVVSRLACGEEAPDLAPRLDEARRLLDVTALGPSTAAIAAAAHRRGIPVTRLNEDSLVQLGHGEQRRLIQATIASTTSSVSVEIASDKQLTRELLDRAFIPTPWGGVAATEAEAVGLFERIDGPVVAKPLHGNQGRAVTIGITTREEVAAAFRAATTISSRVVVEERLTGRDYRVIVIGGRFVAASERKPAQVIGDGRRSIEALVAEVNRDPRRGESHEKPLTRLVLDELAEAQLAAQGLRVTDVPEAGRIVALRATANLSTGGTARDVTDAVHPDIVLLCERA